MYQNEEPTVEDKMDELDNDLIGKYMKEVEAKKREENRNPKNAEIDLNKRYRLPDRGVEEDLIKAACDQRLDTYWDLLIEREYSWFQKPADEKSEGDANQVQDRDGAKLRAYKKTSRLRNAFRQAMLRDDWGMMSQSVDAARIPWTAWLTTNFTRFADRAIQLNERHSERGTKKTGEGQNQKKGEPFPDWRIVSTATEASLVLRETLFDHDTTRSTASLLFKMHGDISHLHTMAIAGQDKEFFNSTGLPLDNLSLIYQAAQRYLESKANDQAKAKRKVKVKVYWHIVGHNMEDQLLCETIYRVSMHVLQMGGECYFTIVSPTKPQVVWSNFLKSIGGRDERIKEFKVLKLQGTAFEHMSNLRYCLKKACPDTTISLTDPDESVENPRVISAWKTTTL